MNQQEATDFVIRELGKHHQRNDIVQNLCEATSMSWEEAKKFIQQVEAQHRGQIAKKQSPLIVIMGTGSIITGFFLSIVMIYATLQGWIFFLLSMPIPYLGNVVYFLIGIGMIVGGLRGMWDTIVQIWNN